LFCLSYLCRCGQIVGLSKKSLSKFLIDRCLGRNICDALPHGTWQSSNRTELMVTFLRCFFICFVCAGYPRSIDSAAFCHWIELWKKHFWRKAVRDKSSNLDLIRQLVSTATISAWNSSVDYFFMFIE
jgi:hypothetical protein